MKFAEHQTYKHTYRCADGSSITDWDTISGTATYNKNDVQKVMSKGEILNIIDDDIIARRLADFYIDANSTDQNNNYNKAYVSVYGDRGFNSADLYNNIKAKATQAMAVKYSGESEDFIKYKAQELTSIILKAIGINLDGDLNDVQGAIQTYFANKNS